MTAAGREPGAAAAAAGKAGSGASTARGPAVGILIAALTIYLGFNAGGFFPGATAVATLGACVLLVLGIMLVSRPFESFDAGPVVPLALLAALRDLDAGLGRLVGLASARALLEFDRALLYVLVFAFFGMLVPGSGAWNGAFAGSPSPPSAICAAGLITRVAADVWPIAADVARSGSASRSPTGTRSGCSHRWV